MQEEEKPFLYYEDLVIGSDGRRVYTDGQPQDMRGVIEKFHAGTAHSFDLRTNERFPLGHDIGELEAQVDSLPDFPEGSHEYVIVRVLRNAIESVRRGAFGVGTALALHDQETNRYDIVCDGTNHRVDGDPDFVIGHAEAHLLIANRDRIRRVMAAKRPAQRSVQVVSIDPCPGCLSTITRSKWVDVIEALAPDPRQGVGFLPPGYYRDIALSTATAQYATPCRFPEDYDRPYILEMMLISWRIFQLLHAQVHRQLHQVELIQ